MGKKHKVIILLLFIIFLLSGCATAPKLSPMQKRAITTRIIEGGYDNIFRSILTVLQDQGYIIKNTDMNTGLITSTIDRETAFGSQFAQALFFGYVADKGSEIDVSVMVNKVNESKSEVRINMQEAKYGQSSKWSGSSKQNVKQILDTEIYNSLFNEIQIEVKRREALEQGDNSIDNNN